MEFLSGADYSAAELSADGSELRVLDQRLLPGLERYRVCATSEDAADAIRDMVVRGAPAIGITAAYGLALATLHAPAPAGDYLTEMRACGQLLIETRPTAVNLSWAVRRCLELAARHADRPSEERSAQMADEARAIHREDVAACHRMGEIGAERLPAGVTVLTHCNAGALATGGYGTALGVVRAAARAGKLARVYATETRPYLQGARLTAWELHRDNIPVTVITDNMVGHCMQRGLFGAVVVGADRIAKNGDVANKIGTYTVACLAHEHGVPFYVAAPWSTVDADTPSGDAITIEERHRGELTHLYERQLVPDGVAVYNPGFDVTPARLVTAIITERGAFAPGDIAAVCSSS